MTNILPITLMPRLSTKTVTRLSKLAYASLLSAVLALPQGPAQAQQADAKHPIAYMQAIGDRIIANTPFAFTLGTNKPNKKFDFVDFVDFGRTLGKSQAATAYAFTDISVLRDTSIVLEFAHPDDAIVYVNGQAIYTKAAKGPVKIVAHERDVQLMSEAKVNLRAGRNSILVKSTYNGIGPWIFYVQPKGATIEFSEVKGLTIGLDKTPNITPEVSALSNWLILGSFPLKGLSTKQGPELAQVAGQTYAPVFGQMYAGYQNEAITWVLPRVEVMGGLINSHPLWGTYYTYNYHAAGVAWAMSHLAKASGNNKYDAFSHRYCDWILNNKAFIGYQVNTLNGFRSAQHHQFNTPLLDFTTAPAMPFVYQLMQRDEFAHKPLYREFVDSIKKYVMTEQVRLPDGTFTRQTPEKYTTWVDDMFMGIPFLVHAALEAQTPAEQNKWWDEAAKQVIGFNKNVYDKPAQLYHHAQYSSRKVFIPHWSRANGWGIFAASEVLQHLPKSHKDYKKVLAIYQDHIKGIVKWQDAKSGFWHQILDDATSYEETSGTAIFTMAIARGLNNGWLDAKTYRPVVDKSWKALTTTFGPDGSVSNICVGTMSSETADYYKNRPAVPDDSHGLLGVLFAGMEMEKLYYPAAKSTKK